MLTVNATPTFAKVGKAFGNIKLGYSIQKGLEEMAFEVERESKRVTPVDTGRLRSSIYTDIGVLRATIAPHTDYAIYVHEGHRTRGNSYVEGRPFMLIGLEKMKLHAIGSQNPIYKEISKYLTAELKKI